MPVSRYFGGHGEEVLANMIKQYGAKKGKSVFYATANKQGQAPEDESVARRARARRHMATGQYSK